MLRSAFNAILKIHSRAAQLKRPGNPDLYSPCRISPSNYFRFLRGPEFTVIHGREFVIPASTMLGSFAQSISFSPTPTAGTFKLSYATNDTSILNWNDNAATIQTALRLLAGLSNVLVTGSISAGLVITFAGFSTAPTQVTVENSTLEGAGATPSTASLLSTYTLWPSAYLERGDKIVDSVYGLMTIDEIIEMVDLGGQPMGFRVRAE